MLKFLVIVLTFAVLVSCTGRHDFVADTAYRFALLKYIERAEDPYKRAERIIQGVDKVALVVEDGELTLDGLEAYVLEAFDIVNRPVSEQILILELISAVKYSLQEAVDANAMNEATRLQITHILGVTRTTASIYLGG